MYTYYNDLNGNGCSCPANDSCKVCHASKLRDKLALPRTVQGPPSQVVRHDPKAVADADATRLGHRVKWWDADDPDAGGKGWAGACEKCDDDVFVLKAPSFDRPRVKGPAVVLRCKG